MVNNRERNLNEVFTPNNIVNKMLNQQEVATKVNDLNSTILEPSAGEGAFLLEILKRRINRAFDISNDQRQFNNNVLLGISTIYGIELLEDDHSILINNMMSLFSKMYKDLTDSDNMAFNEKVIKSGNLIIEANIRQGDTLKRIDRNGDPIVFSEWKIIKNDKVQRIEYTFDDIINERESTVKATHNEQLSLFDDEVENKKDAFKNTFLPVNFLDVYKEELSDQN